MQYHTMHLVRRWTLTTTVLAGTAMIVLLTLNLGDKLNVSLPVFITLASTGAAASVGWIAATCTQCLMRYIDVRFTALNKLADRRITVVADGLTQARTLLSEFATCVAEYGDQCATTSRLEAMKQLANQPVPADTDRIVTHIGRQATR